MADGVLKFDADPPVTGTAEQIAKLREQLGACEVCGKPATSFTQEAICTGPVHAVGDVFGREILAAFKPGKIRRYCAACKPREVQK